METIGEVGKSLGSSGIVPIVLGIVFGHRLFKNKKNSENEEEDAETD